MIKVQYMDYGNATVKFNDNTNITVNDNGYLFLGITPKQRYLCMCHGWGMSRWRQHSGTVQDPGLTWLSFHLATPEATSKICLPSSILHLISFHKASGVIKLSSITSEDGYTVHNKGKWRNHIALDCGSTRIRICRDKWVAVEFMPHFNSNIHLSGISKPQLRSIRISLK